MRYAQTPTQGGLLDKRTSRGEKDGHPGAKNTANFGNAKKRERLAGEEEGIGGSKKAFTIEKGQGGVLGSAVAERGALTYWGGKKPFAWRRARLLEKNPRRSSSWGSGLALTRGNMMWGKRSRHLSQQPQRERRVAGLRHRLVPKGRP